MQEKPGGVRAQLHEFTRVPPRDVYEKTAIWRLDYKNIRMYKHREASQHVES